MIDRPQGWEEPPLDALERLTRAQQHALAQVPEDQPVPPAVLALLAAPAPEIPEHLVPIDEARLAGVQAAITGMLERLERRQDIIRHRLRAVQRARLGHSAPPRWDSRS